jgi:hypothetical protein
MVAASMLGRDLYDPMVQNGRDERQKKDTCHLGSRPSVNSMYVP